MKVAPSRIVFLDLLRSFAVILITFSHAAVAFELWEILRQSHSDAYYLIRFVTRSATPTFLFLFGIMIEVVYVRKVHEKGLRAVSMRLLSRSLQCYIAYAIVCLSALVAGLHSYDETFRQLAFLMRVPVGDILKIYTVILILVIPMLYLRRRIGLIFTAIGVIIIAWLPKIFLDDAYVLQSGSISYVTSFLFGIGGRVGPSVLQGLTIIVFGMLLGETLSGKKIQNPQHYYKRIAENVAIATLMLATVETTTPIKQIIKNYVDTGVYRNLNHPGYYAVGLMWVSILALVFALAFPVARTKSINPVFSVLGKYSLIAFTVGGVFVNLLRSRVTATHLSHAIILNIALIVAVIATVYIYDRWLSNVIKAKVQKVWQKAT